MRRFTKTAAGATRVREVTAVNRTLDRVENGGDIPT